jgi:DNA helicase-2/ATP-dependent DNA helicase PcrA
VTEAVETTERNALVVGGPGSRKTQAIVERIAWLVAAGASPSGIAAVTYTNEAARVVQERVGHALGFCGTLHGFCLAHIAAHVLPDRELRVVDDAERDAMLLKAADECGVKATVAQLRKACSERAAGEGVLQDPGSPLAVAVKSYQTSAIFQGLLDFESVLGLALGSLRRQDTPRTAWSDLVVDEFQDAAPIDAMIYRLVPAARRFYVGDPMQAIFGFRGGSVAEFHRLEADPAWAVFWLMRNWRSGPEICEAASRLAGRAAHPPPSPMVSEAPPGAFVGCQGHPNEATEAWWVLSGALAEIGRGVDPGQLAVLARTNAVAGYLADTLAANGCPVRRLAEVRRPADWRLATAALEVLARPRSTAALLRFARASDPRLDAYYEREIARGRDAVRSLSVKTKRPITGDADKLPEEMLALGASQESVNVVVKRFAELPETASLLDLANSLALEGLGRQMEGEGVFCGTIHSAKGREWDEVWLAGMEDEACPGRQKSADVEEERRVAYVGMTRARRSLAVSWCRSRRERWGVGALRSPSRFLAEAGFDLSELEM